VQLAGTDYLLRHISPVMIPLAISIGVVFGAIDWGRSKATVVTSRLLFSGQLLMLLFPVIFPNHHPVDPGVINGFPPWRVMIRFEQWDWKPLRDITESCGIKAPKISYLGNGRAFNSSQIQYPWVAEGLAPFDVPWLWRYEDGSIDWPRVTNLAELSDVVITAPNYVGQITDRQDLDNQNNAEFARRLGQDAQFQGPVRLTMGQLDPVAVEVFLKKSLACH
jgi:hypothetical protein